MVYLLEISLLSQLVVGRPGLLRSDSGLIQLLLQGTNLITQFLVLLVNGWNLWHQALIQFTLGLKLKPLLLERIQSLLHSELDEEVAEELVRFLIFGDPAVVNGVRGLAFKDPQLSLGLLLEPIKVLQVTP